MGNPGVMIQGLLFEHQISHFVLPYSNWETGAICFSEGVESLSEGLQNALWELGGMPETHRTDRPSTAVHKTDHSDEFARRCAGEKSQPPSRMRMVMWSKTTIASRMRRIRL
jgi:hypothetical protein